MQNPSKSYGIIENGVALVPVKPGDGLLEAGAPLDLGARSGERNVDMSRLGTAYVKKGNQMIVEQSCVLAQLLQCAGHFNPGRCSKFIGANEDGGRALVFRGGK